MLILGQLKSLRQLETSMIIYLDEYRTDKAAPATWLKNGTYGDEVMQAGWNPAVVHIVPEHAPAAPSPDLPHDMSTIDVDAFLNRVYGLSTLI